MNDPCPATAASARSPFPRRVLRAALLRPDIYEEVEADRSSMGQALAVVLVASTAAAAGALLRHGVGQPLPPQAPPVHWLALVLFIEPLVTWLLGSAFAYMVGATFFRGAETETDYREVLRTTGFAFGPGVLALTAFMTPHILALAVLALARIWVWVACVVAVRQALDFTTLRAVGTFGSAALLLWLVLWGLSVAPVPL